MLQVEARCQPGASHGEHFLNPLPFYTQVSAEPPQKIWKVIGPNYPSVTSAAMQSEPVTSSRPQWLPVDPVLQQLEASGVGSVDGGRAVAVGAPSSIVIY